MRVKQTTDEEVKERMLARLTASDDELLQMLIKRHQENAPYLKMRMAIWLNADKSPWKDGVTLLEICENTAVDRNPEFCPIEFAPHSGWPRIRTILTHRAEFIFDTEISNAASEQSYLEYLREKLRDGSAKIVHPSGQNLEDFERLIAQPWKDAYEYTAA